MSWLTLRCRGPREQGWLGWLRLGARSAERLRPLVLRRAPARRVLASAPPCRERHCSDQTEHPVTHSLSARQPPTHSSARAAPWTRAQARPCRPGEGATERVSNATARTPRSRGAVRSQGPLPPRCKTPDCAGACTPPSSPIPGHFPCYRTPGCKTNKVRSSHRKDKRAAWRACAARASG